MDAVDHLRGAIKSHFTESLELQLSSYFANHPRFNFYFSIKADYPFLLYLNVDGDGNRFVLKCLEFANAEVLSALIAAYPETGSKAFNIGQPRSAVSFIYFAEEWLVVQELRGVVKGHIHTRDISQKELMQKIDPSFE